MISRSTAPTRPIGGMDLSGFCACCTIWSHRGYSISTPSYALGEAKPCSISDAAADFMSEALATKGATVIGVDPSEAAIRAAQNHADQQALEIDYRVGRGEKSPSCRS